jgi:hypothetical protein
VLGSSALSGDAGWCQLGAGRSGRRSAEDLVAPGEGADHQQDSRQDRYADGDVDQCQAARQDPRDKQYQGRYNDPEDRAESHHGCDQPARPVRSRAQLSRIGLSGAELGWVRLSTCLGLA